MHCKWYLYDSAEFKGILHITHFFVTIFFVIDAKVFGDEPHLAGGVTVAVTVPARLLQRRHT